MSRRAKHSPQGYQGSTEDVFGPDVTSVIGSFVDTDDYVMEAKVAQLSRAHNRVFQRPLVARRAEFEKILAPLEEALVVVRERFSIAEGLPVYNLDLESNPFNVLNAKVLNKQTLRWENQTEEGEPRMPLVFEQALEALMFKGEQGFKAFKYFNRKHHVQYFVDPELQPIVSQDPLAETDSFEYLLAFFMLDIIFRLIRKHDYSFELHDWAIFVASHVLHDSEERKPIVRSILDHIDLYINRQDMSGRKTFLYECRLLVAWTCRNLDKDYPQLKHLLAFEANRSKFRAQCVAIYDAYQHWQWFTPRLDFASADIFLRLFATGDPEWLPIPRVLAESGSVITQPPSSVRRVFVSYESLTAIVLRPDMDPHWTQNHRTPRGLIIRVPLEALVERCIRQGLHRVQLSPVRGEHPAQPNLDL